MTSTPTHVYVVTHSAFHAGKVGIADLDSVRIAQHRSHGWHLYRAVLLPSRNAAQQVERFVLQRLRAAGVSAHMPADRMPQGGQTETVNLDEVPAVKLWDLVVAAAGEVQDQVDASRVVLFLAHASMHGFPVLIAGTDEPHGVSKGSPECSAAQELAAGGWLVYTANMSAAQADVAVRNLRTWSAKAEAVEASVLIAEHWPVPLLRSSMYILPSAADEGFGQARIAVGVPLHRLSADAADEDD
ncbi:hypothetical protein [Kitasatospora purpeofusca]|uniref:hypothetical protein n=1 Tax=Kitasatospora purpeofusca TaxID=67352 RepID=UPI0038649887